jgi:4-amino-4-deoxy-L-arabinose transferase-like glycosyltransferase
MAAKKVKWQRPPRPPTDQPSNGHRAVAQEDAWGTGDWRFRIAAGLIVAGALFLRLYRIGGQELWFDETFSWYMATTPKLLKELLIENSPPLYYLLQRAWVGVAGESEAALRLLSAVAGTLFVATVLWAGRELFDTRVALWSGGAAALTPLHIYYSQEARAYAWLVFLLLLTHVLLWRALRRNTWPAWTLATVSALLALYTHYFAILGLLPSAGLLWLWPGKAGWQRYGAAMLGCGLGFLPWVVWSFGLTPRSYAEADWIQRFWEATPPWLAIPRSLEVFGLGPQAGLRLIFFKQFSTLEFPLGLCLLGLLGLALLGLWVAVPRGDQRIGVPDLGKRKAWLGLLLFLPLGMLWLVSFSLKPLYAVGRYDLVAFPAYPLLLGLALTKAQRVKRVGPIVAPIAALLLLLPIGSKLVRYYQAPPSNLGWDPRATAQVLHAEVADGDVVVFTGLRGFPVLYYLSRLGYRWDAGECRNVLAGRRFGCRMYPPRQPDARRILASPDALRADVQDFLRKLPPQGSAVWVISEFNTFPQGTPHLSEPDLLLVRQLQGSGLEFSPVEMSLGIFRFHQP